MSSGSSRASDGDDLHAFEDTDALMPCLSDQLKEAGLDASRGDQCMELLKQCNVHTRGALRLFAPQCSALVNTMFDMDTALGPLQATGFLASLRVQLSGARTSMPCSTLLTCRALRDSSRRRLWLVYQIRLRPESHWNPLASAVVVRVRLRRHRQGGLRMELCPPFDLHYEMWSPWTPTR